MPSEDTMSSARWWHFVLGWSPLLPPCQTLFPWCPKPEPWLGWFHWFRNSPTARQAEAQPCSPASQIPQQNSHCYCSGRDLGWVLVTFSCLRKECLLLGHSEDTVGSVISNPKLSVQTIPMTPSSQIFYVSCFVFVWQGHGSGRGWL